jgi:hypothetical protein
VRPRLVEFAGTSRFRPVGCLGAGGMGVVYEAVDEERQEHVALKTLRRQDAEALARFKSEFRSLSGLRHPNLVRLDELFEEGGQWFFTMELVPGVDFVEYIRGASRSGPRVTVDLGAPSARDVVAATVTAELPCAEGERMPRQRAEAAPEPAACAPTAPAQSLGDYDEVRLRSALAQLARGLHALHRIGKIHRDVKPANVRVTPEGRVVLLDFGLVTEAGLTVEVAGTGGYMAPEQAAGLKVGAPADWFAVGVLLHQALSGGLPGATVRGPEVADDLEALAADLLRFDPALRPSGREVLERLSTRRIRRRAAGAGREPEATPFQGRLVEQAGLDDALRRTREGRRVALTVRGPSGVGKTALVERFLARIAEPRVVLRSRCQERESVPFQALDGIIDALARHADAQPADAAVLAEMFPTLERVLRAASADAGDPRPSARRVRAVAVLRRWLGNLARRGPVVLFIDDLQWADAGSLTLLAELLREPDAPPILCLAALRLGGSDASEALPADTHHLTLEPLLADEARALAGALLGEDGPRAQEIATRSGGHPWFLLELAHEVRAFGQASAPGGMDGALAARIARLPAPVRRVLEVAAICGGPIDRRVVRRAAEADQAELAGAIEQLYLANLARTTLARPGEGLEVVHDRVREVVVDQLGPAACRELHGRVARALEQSGTARAEALAMHFAAAGERDRAAPHFRTAALEAERRLAFDHAARLWGRTIDCAPRDRAARAELQVRRADALAQTGQGALAAVAYLEAADALRAAADRLELERRAALELLHVGHIDDGLALLERVLRAAGVRMPRTPGGALLGLLARRAQLRLRGMRFRPRRPEQASVRALARVDACRTAAEGLGYVDNIRAAHQQARHLLAALAAGEPQRIAMATAIEASFAAATGPRGARRSARLVSRVAELAESTSDPMLLGMADFAAGFSALQQGRWRPGLLFCERAILGFRTTPTGARWHLAVAQVSSLWCRAYLGELAELRELTLLRLREAEDRGDHFSTAWLRTGVINVAWLVIDDPALAVAQAREAVAEWSRAGFHAQHCFALAAEVGALLYQGEGARALALMDERWPELRRSRFLYNQLVRITMTQLRGSAALAAAGGTDGDERQRLLLRARRARRRLGRERVRWASALGGLLDAGILACSGRREEARARFAGAAMALEEADMPLYAQVAQLRRGELLGGEAGQALVAEAHRAIAARGVVRPDGLARLYCPR